MLWNPGCRRLASGCIVALGLLLASTASAASPNLDLDATDATVGQAIHADARLSESPNADGEISFEIFGPDDPGCAGPALTPAPAATTVDGEGEYSSGNFTAPAAGVYSWSAHYSGDLENTSADATCAALSNVAKAAPGIEAAATPAAIVGGAIADVATLSGGFAPGGQLLFRAYGPGDASCATAPAYEATVAVNGGSSYSPPGFSPGPGLYRWTAEYGGDSNNEAVGTACGALDQASAVTKATPGIGGVATAAAVVGSPIADSATLSGGFAAGGQIVFRAYSDASCATAPAYEAAVAVNGGGSYSPPGFSPGPGLYRWTAEYGGDSNNEAVGTSCGAAGQSSAVAKAAPSLAGTATAAVIVGSPIADVANLSGGFTPGGTLVFRAYADASCATIPAYEATVAVNGAGPYSPAGFSPGPGLYRWTVEYGGDPDNEAASTACGAAGQSSTVGKATPTIVGIASSVVIVGSPIADSATLGGGFAPGGTLVFRAYGPGDPSCATAPAYEAAVGVNGAGSYSPTGFSPGPGLYRWTVEYQGDPNNEAASSACGADNQASAVGVVSPSLTAGAGGATVGDPVTATASLQEGAIPGGEIAFRAFAPGDASCSGAVAFSSTVAVAGNGSYRSVQFVPSRVGSFRWIVSYSGDANHAPAATACGAVRSVVSQARPAIAGTVSPVLTVGTPFRDTATLTGAHAPTGTVTFRIYGPVASGCAKPAFVNTVAANGSGAIQSDPFVAKRPGRYSFVASYSGDAANQGATEACDAAGQTALVQKRVPRVKPRARLKGSRTILIRANLANGASPAGVINFRLYGPGGGRCKGKPAFSGGISVRSNGTYSLAKFLATRQGTYRLLVGYSGDPRNKRAKGACDGAQVIRVG